MGQAQRGRGDVRMAVAWGRRQQVQLRVRAAPHPRWRCSAHSHACCNPCRSVPAALQVHMAPAWWLHTHTCHLRQG